MLLLFSHDKGRGPYLERCLWPETSQEQQTQTAAAFLQNVIDFTLTIHPAPNSSHSMFAMKSLKWSTLPHALRNWAGASPLQAEGGA